MYFYILQTQQLMVEDIALKLSSYSIALAFYANSIVPLFHCNKLFINMAGVNLILQV